MIDKSLRTNDILGAQPKSYRGSFDSFSPVAVDKMAGIPNYYCRLQPIPYSITDRNIEDSSRGRKRRFHLPENQIATSNIFQPPKDEYYPTLNESSQIGYNRSLQTDDIQGTKPGTYTNPSLKNLFRGKQIKDYQQWMEENYKNEQKYHLAENSKSSEPFQPTKTEQEIQILKQRLNDLQQQVGSPNQSQQMVTAHNILQPKQYPKQCENDEKSLWGKLLSGRRHETDNVLKFGQGFKQLGYIYKQY